MNEIEERNNLDPEVAESIRSTAEEVAQNAIDRIESHVEANGISYVNAMELNSILLLLLKEEKNLHCQEEIK